MTRWSLRESSIINIVCLFLLTGETDVVPKPLVLMILDGWGEAPPGEANAITQACPENFLALQAEFPHTFLETSGLEVGLPRGQMGNSEVGHLNMGAGRTVYQEITRISRAVEDGSFYENQEFNKVIDHCLGQGGALHLMGLVSDGGVHSSMDHLVALLELARRRGLDNVYVHAFLDGRDVPPMSALNYLDFLEDKLHHLRVGRIATVMGRFYAMDRDKRWERNELAFAAMVKGQGVNFSSAQEAVKSSYAEEITDEFMKPAVVVDESCSPIGLMRDGDGIIFFNFRADRARQITRAFVDREFSGFERPFRPDTYYVCLTQYDATIKAPVAFMPQNLPDTLGEYLSKQGLRQLRVAETEKYAHVTFFFNGGVEEPNINEDRVLIPSPPVATYDLLPQMSAFEITSRLIGEIEKEKYDVIIINYANPDMVGHTGVMAAAVTAVKTVDQCLSQVVEKVREMGGVVLITADHGNAESMRDEDSHQPHTAHTTNPVPFIIAGDAYRGRRLREGGSLRDIAPTMLGLLNLDVPQEMTGTSLLLEV